jgi:hypothetical protein
MSGGVLAEKLEIQMPVLRVQKNVHSTVATLRDMMRCSSDRDSSSTHCKISKKVAGQG